jgi:hypothetical protein
MRVAGVEPSDEHRQKGTLEFAQLGMPPPDSFYPDDLRDLAHLQNHSMVSGMLSINGGLVNADEVFGGF